MDKVIYTCITNDYDTLKEPLVITDGWDYICFTDNKNLTSKTWKIVQMGINSNMQLEQRKKKINNKYILDDYDLSIWVDGSICVNTNLDTFVEVNHKSDFSLMKHPSRSCVYQEGIACVQLSKDKKETIRTQIQRYALESYPHNNGMVATGVMIRTHTSEVKEFCKRWYKELSENSIRDQLSFNYIDWLYPINYTTFGFGVLRNQFIINGHK